MNQKSVLMLVAFIVVAGASVQAATPLSGEALTNRIRMLERDLALVVEMVRTAEDDMIEFERVNQMEYVQMKGELELNDLKMLISAEEKASKEKWSLEVFHPFLRESDSFGTLIHMIITNTTANAGAVVPPSQTAAKPGLTTMSATNDVPSDTPEEQEAVRAEYRRLNVWLDALEEAQRRWRNSYLLASKKRSEYNHLQANAERMEATYKELADELHALRMQRDLKSLQTTK